MSITLEDRLKIYIADYPTLTSRQLAVFIKETESESIWSMSRKDLGRIIASIKHPKPAPDTSFYTVIIGCSHLPFQDKEQWDAMSILSKWLSSVHKTRLILAGDILDMNSISRHAKGKVAKIPGMTLGKEYDLSNIELDKLQDGNFFQRDYMYGNHETWHQLYMQEIDGSKLGDAVKSPVEALFLEERGYQVHTKYGQDYLKIGNLIVTHGNYVNKHASFSHLEAYKENVLFFHTHRMGSFTDSGANNSTITGYNAGFAGDRTQPVFNYMPEDMKRRWQNGFAITYTDNEGETHVTLLQWKNKKFVFMNREFSATGIKVIGE